MTESQSAFAYDAAQLKVLVRVISLERLQPYLYRTRDDKWLAIQLYNRNTELSKEFYGIIQVLEVLLRNVIHNAMMKALASESWYFTLPLRDAELDDIREAEEGIGAGVNSTWLRQRSREFIPDGTDPDFVVKPGRVIAALNFGFWVKLCAHAYGASVWPLIQDRFPRHLSRQMIHERLMELKTLRNRIAHHETLIKRDREKDYALLLETIGWLSPTAAAWAKSENRCLEILGRPLPKRPKSTPAVDPKEQDSV
jgi:hypothetical protein